MELLPYYKFSRLRISQFLLPAQIFENAAGAETPLPGRRPCPCYHSSVRDCVSFFYAEHPPRNLVAIRLNVDEIYISTEVLQRVVTACVPPLRLGMKAREVTALLGAPEHRRTEADRQHLRFRIGRQWPYRLLARFTPAQGLGNLSLLRDDFYKADGELAA